MNLLITGATGFVGVALCHYLAAEPFPFQTIYGVCRSSARADKAQLPTGIPPLVTSLEALAANSRLLCQIDCMIHLAARVHQMVDTAADPLAAFRATNTEATLALAQAAAQAGVKRFIYLSTVKVYGDGTQEPRPWTEQDQPAPVDPYGLSKWEAETQLRQLSDRTGLEVVILRPPLVYGPGVKANFLQLLAWVHRGVPLPLGQITNARSLVYVGNLVDAIGTCITHPAAANQTFLVSDGSPVSTPELIRAIARAFDRPALLLPIPPRLLQGFGQLSGKTATVNRLLESLVVDSRHIQTSLDWQPPHSLATGLQATAAWYCRQ